MSHQRCTPTPQCPYQVSTTYTLRLPRYSPDKPAHWTPWAKIIPQLPLRAVGGKNGHHIQM